MPSRSQRVSPGKGLSKSSVFPIRPFFICEGKSLFSLNILKKLSCFMTRYLCLSGLSLKDQSLSLKISELLLKPIAIAKRLIAKLDRAKILEMEFLSIRARGGLISRGLIIRRYFCLQVDGLMTAWLPMKTEAHCTNFKF